jgi:hypothetical protein
MIVVVCHRFGSLYTKCKIFSNIFSWCFRAFCVLPQQIQNSTSARSCTVTNSKQHSSYCSRPSRCTVLSELWQYTEGRRTIYLRVCAFCEDETTNVSRPYGGAHEVLGSSERPESPHSKGNCSLTFVTARKFRE